MVIRMSRTDLRTYTELSKLKTFAERFEYLKLNGEVGKDTFGYDRYLNQRFYHSPEWRRIRDQIIVRDNGCDLGVEGYTIYDKIYIHHMNPITVMDIYTTSGLLTMPEFLICVSYDTHNAIHYGDASKLRSDPVERRPNDTCPWKL
jgi:hypothetical protein